MKVRDFAQEKRIDVIDTNQSSVVFKMKNGRELVVKNTIQGISSAVYMFDGKKEPQRIQDVATFDDGKEFQRYFGTKN